MIFLWLLMICFFPFSTVSPQEKSDWRSSSIDDFVDWFIDNDGELNDINIVPSEIAGYGVIASKDLMKGDVIFRVPFPIILNVDEMVNQMRGTSMGEVPPPNLIAIFISHEYSKGEESFYNEYLHSLPREFKTPLYHPLSVLELWQGSPFKGLIQQRIQDAQWTYTRLSAEFRQMVTFADYLWGLSIFYSRILDVEVPKDNKMDQWYTRSCLIPGVDFMNSGPGMINVQCGTNENGTYFECETLEIVFEGDELFVSYLQLTENTLDNGRLYADYGFTVGGAGLNFATVIIEMPPLPEKKQEIMTRLHDNGLKINPNSSVFEICGRGDAVDENMFMNLLIYGRLLSIEEHLLETPFETLEPILVRNFTIEIDDESLIKLEKQVFEHILEIINKQLDSYGTTIIEDIEILKNVSKAITDKSTDCASLSLDDLPESWCDMEAIQAILGIRIGEKQILNFLKHFFSSVIPDMQKPKKKKEKIKKKRKRRTVKREL